jgi:hypothetical protein
MKEIIAIILKPKNFSSSIIFQAPGTWYLMFLVCTMHHTRSCALWLSLIANKINRSQNQQERSRANNMLSEWSYKHCLLIEVETVLGPCTESAVFIFIILCPYLAIDMEACTKECYLTMVRYRNECVKI